MARHATGVRPLVRHQVQHRCQEVRDPGRLFLPEVVLLPQHVEKRPVPEAVDVAELALAVEDLLGPTAREAQRLGEGTQKLDDLRYVVVVLSVLRARLRIEEVVACY